VIESEGSWPLGSCSLWWGAWAASYGFRTFGPWVVLRRSSATSLTESPTIGTCSSLRVPLPLAFDGAAINWLVSSRSSSNPIDRSWRAPT